MSKIIELGRKIKALADKGVGGEKLNAEKMLQDFIKKHNIKIEDIEGEEMSDYFFKLNTDIERRLFPQIGKSIRYNLKLYGEITKKVIKDYGLDGNFMVTCTLSEFIELKSKLHFYSELYKEEIEIFFTAFVTANDLLINPPSEIKRDITDLTQKELDEFHRVQKMSSNIKKGNFMRQLGS